MTADTLRDRVEVLYLAATDGRTVHGAAAWLDRRLGYTGPNSTVGRWLAGRSRPPAQALKHVEDVESIVRLTKGERVFLDARERLVAARRGR